MVVLSKGLFCRVVEWWGGGWRLWGGTVVENLLQTSDWLERQVGWMVVLSKGLFCRVVEWWGAEVVRRTVWYPRILLMSGHRSTSWLKSAASHLRASWLYWYIAVGVGTTILVKLLLHGDCGSGRGAARMLMHLMRQSHLRVEQVVVGMWGLALGQSWHPRVQTDHPA